MMRSNAGLLRSPQEILFSPGAVRALPRVLAKLGTKTFVCVDEFLMSSAAFRTLREDAKRAGVTLVVHSDVAPELPLDGVRKAISIAGPENPDVVLGLGGGSAIDLAKLVALGLSADGDISDYYGENMVPTAILPVVAVPTTAGTGSEVTPVAVVTDPGRALKVGVSSPHLVPTAAIVDPELSHTCPPSVTAYSGIDALCHAIESFTAKAADPNLADNLPVFVGANILSEVLAVEAAREITKCLPIAVNNGHDVHARAAMSRASLLAGMAFGTAGTHLGHAIQYPVGAVTHTPHGLGVGLLLPYVMEACLPFAPERLSQLGVALGVSAGSSQEAAGAHAVSRVVEIRSRIGVPHTLAELGLSATDLPKITELALTVRRLVDNGPGPDPEALVEAIVQRSWSGDSDIFHSAG